MLNLRLLPEYLLRGTKRVKLFDKVGLKAEETAFAIKRGGSYEGWGIELIDVNSSNIQAINSKGEIHDLSDENPMIGLRPIINYSEIKKSITNKIYNEQGVLEVEYGEYPQSLVDLDNDSQYKIEQALELGKLGETGKTYTICVKEVDYSNKEPKFKSNSEKNDFVTLKEYISEDGKNMLKKVAFGIM